jgi:UDP-glucose 4-epimerase
MPAIANGKFVILGGASQVGSHIGEQLLAANVREVVLLDNLSLGPSETMDPLLTDPRCSFVRGDMMRLPELIDPLRGADGVFSVAGAMASTIRDNPWLALDLNIRGFQNGLEACRIAGVKKVVISSSVGVYGELADHDVVEETPLRWQNTPPATMIYAAGKIIGEGLAQTYQQSHGLDYVSLRYSGVYGTRQHRRAMMGGHIAETCRRIRRGKQPIIDGDGSQVQDYIYVGDVARANLMAMESDISGEAFNIVSGHDTSQARVVEIGLKVAGSSLEPKYRPLGPLPVPPSIRQGYSREKAKRLLRWEPKVSIEEGIAMVLAWVDASQSH